jgi:dTDP-4-amino-4,6-dideoxygalactose transaminase
MFFERVELFDRAVSPRTRAVLVAHLFGGRVDLGHIADFAREHHLLLFDEAPAMVAEGLQPLELVSCGGRSWLDE